MHVWGKRALPAFLVAGMAVSAGAQQKACDIDEGTPGQVARAMLDLSLAQSASKPEDVTKGLRDAVKLLNEGDLTKNPVGRAMVYGKALVTWMAQPGVSYGMTTRGAIGLPTDPAAPFDLVAAIDSSFSIVEASNPDCATQTGAWRQQKGWVDMINHAIELGNAGNQADSATLLAKRSLQLFRAAPYGYMVLAKVSSEQNQPKEAIAYYKQAVGAAANDTSAAMQDNRRNMLMTIGNYAVDLYDTATGAEKTTYMQEAKSAFEALAKDPGTKYADAARGGLARLAAASGDTAAIKASYADKIANPGAFSYASLMSSAVTAAQTSQTKDAIKLFEAARALNPYHRDVLYNLSRLYLLDSAYTKGLPYAQQLVSVDPSNPDNYQLLAIGYAAVKKEYDVAEAAAENRAKVYGERANRTKSAAVRKANIDSAARVNPVIKAYADSSKSAIDSALKYQAIMEKLPAKVVFTEFTPGDAKTTLAGTVTNQTDAARPFTFQLEFIDKDGKVVTTQPVNVPSVPPHETAKFEVTGVGAAIIAFRYPPIP